MEEQDGVPADGTYSGQSCRLVPSDQVSMYGHWRLKLPCKVLHVRNLSASDVRSFVRGLNQDGHLFLARR